MLHTNMDLIGFRHRPDQNRLVEYFAYGEMLRHYQ
ncbi:hypothetical protein PYK22_01421 [Pyrinomonas methylaliphatogenes]|uniref:Uncharacterized protein n=1 Tax=Pyrinomonas methylaliphatogenes TaxID=454194 RepID=A0A0B6WXG1_9BACT|nr:hypothetical protein PYK22_01421 [Pyrinomonas methylaliphatogenes]